MGGGLLLRTAIAATIGTCDEPVAPSFGGGSWAGIAWGGDSSTNSTTESEPEMVDSELGPGREWTPKKRARGPKNEKKSKRHGKPAPATVPPAPPPDGDIHSDEKVRC